METDAVDTLLSWLPLVLFSLFWVAVMAISRRNQVKWVNEMAAVAHADAERIIAVLEQIRDQTPAEPIVAQPIVAQPGALGPPL